MARSLTTNASTEKNANSARPVNVVEIVFGGSIGTKYYSDRSITTPIVAESRVTEWGELDFSVIEEKGEISDYSFSLDDSDLVLLGYTRSQDLQKIEVKVWQWWTNLTSWSDAVLLFRGNLRSYTWEESPSPTLHIEVENWQKKYEDKLGTVATKDIFSQIRKSDEGKVLPLCYGTVRRGEAVQVIDARRTTLAIPLKAVASEAIVTDSRDFDQGITNLYDILIGKELIRGYFSGAKLYLLQRGKVLTTGYTWGSPPNSRTFLTNLTPAGPSWIGFKVKFYLAAGTIIRQITNYTSPNIYGIDAYAVIPGGVYFEIFGEQTKHDAGTAVLEHITNYTWIVNDAPSTSFESLEILGSIILTGENVSNKLKNLNVWLTLDSSYYTVNLSDSTWAAQLGHNVTSITMPFDPKNLPNSPYASNDIKPSFTAINYSNAIDIIVDLAKRLGFSYPSDFDTTSESSVRSLVAWLSLSVQIKNQEGLDLLYWIAFQARISLTWEQGLLHFKYLENKTSTSVVTIDDTKRELESLKISQKTEEVINRVVAKFYENGIEKELVAEDSSSISKYGKREKEIDLRFHHVRAYAEAIATFWLRRWSNASETTIFKTFLNTLELERYDWVTASFSSFYSSQPAEILRIAQGFGSGEDEKIDEIEIEAKVPIYAGCASTCEAYEQTGCASTCEQVCQTASETSCNYACETSTQDACSLTCVSTCELECTSYYEMKGCASGCETGCQARCQTGCTTSGCQAGSCTASCTAGCQQSCTTGCEVACESGACQLACESVAQSTCTDSCELGKQTCASTCETTCQGSCTLACTTSCESSCETSGCQLACQATSCTLCCEQSCQTTCQNACQVGTCQSSCTNDCQQGCQVSCVSTCETHCEAQCEQKCQSCCQFDGTETAWECTSACQTGCQQACETVDQTQGYVGACWTACQSWCMTTSETGCGTYCTVGCECYCQATCEAACMTTTCQTACQCDCQTAVQPTPCSTSTEGACYSTCQAYAQTGCTTSCETGCQDSCQLGCQEGCELYCTTGCQCVCQSTCELKCTTSCESACECTCQASYMGNMGGCDPLYCQVGCQTSNMTNVCLTSCVGSCVSYCETYCQSNCTTSACQTACQYACMTGSCTTGCEAYCTVGCQCYCQSQCESTCVTGCETICECLCQTAAQ